MKIQSVIDYVNRVKPNSYSTTDKVEWIGDLDTSVSTEVMKKYYFAELTTTPGETIYPLPDGVEYEDIEAVYFDGKEVDKLDFRSYISASDKINVVDDKPIAIKIVYLVDFDRYRNTIYTSGSNEITFTANKIVTTRNDFSNLAIGDTLTISGASNTLNNKQVIITGVFSNEIWVADNTFVAAVDPNVITIAKLLNEELLVTSPYDRMYREYIEAKIDWYNKDYESYNNSIKVFDATWKDFTNYYKQRNPQTNQAQTKNIW